MLVVAHRGLRRIKKRTSRKSSSHKDGPKTKLRVPLEYPVLESDLAGQIDSARWCEMPSGLDVVEFFFWVFVFFEFFVFVFLVF